LAAVGYGIGSVLNRYDHDRDQTIPREYQRTEYGVNDPTNPIYSDFYNFGGSNTGQPVFATVGINPGAVGP